MQEQRHKRKESYSIFIVSNIDKDSRQFHITPSSLRLLFFLPFLIFIVIGVFIFLFVFTKMQADKLNEQLLAQKQLSSEWDAEKEALNNEKQELETEIAALRRELEERAPVEEPETEEESVQDDSSFPSRYPSSGAGVLTATYSEEHPYISITTYRESDIIAAGDGVVTAITSDDTYPCIIEITHDSGYKTRYFYHEQPELKVEEGAQVEGGGALFTVTAEEAELDYQVIYEEQPIDPLTVIDAKG